ncbi:cytochrome c oxidase, subunit VIa [Saitoella complicata NRRL Y-17804]|uniref:cytochrome c oxidase, subunit VIa n=1 Tax=Saitoella complicata (strain BCRC 22490 / CBS 7301 / JCM 7358 / NBRC 10748 / NRRL Y-17804) TaxID=698492 RepID=UPI000867B940|nr:cytochrome c oxidase, subunit VIa [Saitoella complicata NRRL Y-17804]ODQ50600.1 cytochrome c oxidase, subunit VIa [Saitoella complicata NRRL Y-17804]
MLARSAFRTAATRTVARNVRGNASSTSSGAEFLSERAAVEKHSGETADLWRKITYYIAFPLIIVGAVNAKNLYDEHNEHMAHVDITEQPQYAYLNIRTKNFPWGDGDKTAFWNDKVNYHPQD